MLANALKALASAESELSLACSAGD